MGLLLYPRRNPHLRGYLRPNRNAKVRNFVQKSAAQSSAKVKFSIRFSVSSLAHIFLRSTHQKMNPRRVVSRTKGRISSFKSLFPSWQPREIKPSPWSNKNSCDKRHDVTDFPHKARDTFLPVHSRHDTTRHPKPPHNVHKRNHL